MITQHHLIIRLIQGNHAKRINDVINNRDYLAGKHKVLLRQDSQYKGNERFNMFKKILNMQGIKVDGDVDVIYNVSMPIASTEMIANLKALQEMGAISRETIMEKSEYITDVDVEKKRLQGENVAEPKVSEVPKDKENP